MPLHIAVIAFRMAALKPHIFIEIKYGGLRIADQPLTMRCRQFLIDADRRTSGGKPEDGPGFVCSISMIMPAPAGSIPFASGI